MVNRCLLFTEGPHDQAVLSKLLLHRGFNEINKREHVDTFWSKLLPTRLSTSGRLHYRLAVPAFFDGDESSVAIFAGEGLHGLPKTCFDLTEGNPEFVRDVFSFGVVIDTDQNDPDQNAKMFSNMLNTHFPGFPSKAGVVNEGPPKTGVFVLPDNRNPGVLDTILVRCGSEIYNPHLLAAERFLAELDDDKKQHWKAHDEAKALVATITSVLRPGMSNTSSLKNDDWICDQTCDNVEELRLLSQFLQELVP